MEEKIKAINSYLEFVGSCIRFENYEDKYYCNNDVETCDDFDEVSEAYINNVYDDAVKNVKALAEKFGILI